MAAGTGSRTVPRRPERWIRLFALAVAVLGVLLLIGAAFSVKVRPDAEAYWLAAQRLRGGLPLYGGPRGDETQIYRYAPWFAYAWLPLTYLAHDAAFAVWRGILLAASLGGIWPLLRRPTLASVTLAVLFGGEPQVIARLGRIPFRRKGSLELGLGLSSDNATCATTNALPSPNFEPSITPRALAFMAD